MIGISVSFCIKDIVTCRMPLEKVEKIISGIIAPTPEHLEEMLFQYKQGCWREYPEKAEVIFRQLLGEGKIEQPRLVNNNHFPVFDHHWVENEDQIAWYDQRDTSVD